MNRILTSTGWFIGLFSLLVGCNLNPDDEVRERNTGEIAMTPPPQGKSGPLSSLSSDTACTDSQKGSFLPDTLTKQPIKKKKKKSTPPPQVFDQETIQQRMEQIRQLKAREKEIDIASYRPLLNGRSALESQLNDWLYLINPNVYFSVDFENDVFTNTDRYYTNGIRFNLIDPGLNRSFLTKLMIPVKKPVKNYYGISLVHRMYTPKDPHLDTITPGERPFSSYVYLGFTKVSNAFNKRYRQLSAINIGLIGSAAQGEILQERLRFRVRAPHDVCRRER